jgi:hypothetical protein
MPTACDLGHTRLDFFWQAIFAEHDLTRRGILRRLMWRVLVHRVAAAYFLGFVPHKMDSVVRREVVLSIV